MKIQCFRQTCADGRTDRQSDTLGSLTEPKINFVLQISQSMHKTIVERLKLKLGEKWIHLFWLLSWVTS